MYDAAISTPGLTAGPLLGGAPLTALSSVSAMLSSPALVIRTVPGNLRPFKKLQDVREVRATSVLTILIAMEHIQQLVNQYANVKRLGILTFGRSSFLQQFYQSPFIDVRSRLFVAS